MDNADLSAYTPYSPLPSNPADSEMEIYLMIGDDSQIYVLHDRPFYKNLSWIEYNQTTRHLDFIMEDGDLRQFGILVDPNFAKYLIPMTIIAVAEIDNGQYIGGNNYPLIIHREV